MELTQDRLKELVHYNPKTGIFRALTNRGGGRVTIGSQLGCIAKRHKETYYRLVVDGHHYYAHRLAWLYFYGEWPPKQIDHKDGDGTNNKIANLRIATSSENHANVSLRRDNKTGFKGVSFCKKSKKYRATIVQHQRQIWLGTFSTPEEAHEAYTAMAHKLFGDFAHAG